MSEEQLKASQVEIKADTQAEVSDEELESAAGGAGVVTVINDGRQDLNIYE